MKKTRLEMLVPRGESYVVSSLQRMTFDFEGPLSIPLPPEFQESWDEIKRDLNQPMIELSEKFIEICQRTGAISSDPPCAVHLIDEGRIMFNWEAKGRLHFTVMITEEGSGLEVAYAGRFGTDKFHGVDNSLLFIDAPLRKISTESPKRRVRVSDSIGKLTPWTIPLRGSLMNVPEREMSPHSTLPPGILSYRFTQPKMRRKKTLNKWVCRLPEREKDIASMGGRL